ncbi:MAG TPA: phospho-N-acetylmuramoyl-pentapeptide-transferase [Clostridiaceae bacterium]|jgi:phospho-N-acetylmuramoyl-pentapeptide-transferase|nr:phospho-N-acetylmuramoyl-pentapeptide-transferase [Clostridiaceae bacterium]HOA31565.1 phospho-N-acetylmuramoyl-pentapeptide-transferase [Clostridia bacterium]
MTVAIVVFLSTFALAALFGPIYIPILRRLKFGQTVRDDGPATHYKKTGTPTIGGLVFLTPLVIVGLVLHYNGKAPEILPLLFVTIGFGFVGFLDDFIKIVKKSKDGLLSYQKMSLLFIVSLIFTYYINNNADLGTVINIDLFGLHTEFDLGYAFIPFSILVLLSTTNTLNLTDGLDGLCAGTSFIILMFFALVSILVEKNNSVMYFSTALAGGVLGFLLFNYNPARLFMGDTGALALGGAIGACAILLKMPTILLVAGLLFVIEALSVILQISFFKLTKGKRLFKMAPIHHHFELKGWSEIKVVYVFWAFTLICCIAAYICLVI